MEGETFMCGFVGFVSKGNNKKKIIKDMADIIIHRGPDSEGYYINDNVALGFRRLSIIDLDGGSQPIFNEKKDKVIVFNGEIYNYKEIKEELLEKGHVFETESDTEVVIHGYEEYICPSPFLPYSVSVLFWHWNGSSYG